MKLGLGTVQIGLPYGVSNSTGEVSIDEASSILQRARAAGIRTIDTAAAYGDSESRLGQLGLDGFQVVSKVAGVKPDMLTDAVTASISRLRVDSLHGLLLHRASDLLGNDGGDVWRTLERLKADGLVEKIGVSVYRPEELDTLPHSIRPDLVQLPYNILDRRMETSGWLSRLKAMGVEIHARSAFLQGLLLMEAESRPSRFSRWNTIWTIYEAWLAENNLTRLESCLGFALANPLLDRIIVGTQSASQLSQLLAVEPLVTPVPVTLAVLDDDLINPANWNTK